LSVGSKRASDIRAFVPLDTHPMQPLDQFALGIRVESLAVGILDPQDELALGLARVKEVVESAARASEMEAPRRGGCKPDSGWAGGAHGFSGETQGARLS